MKKKLFATAWLAALAIFLTGAVYADHDWNDERYKFEEEYSADLNGINEASIKTVNGAIRVEAWSENRVYIKVDERVKADSESEAAAIAGEIKLVGKVEGSRLSVEIDYGRYENDDRMKSRYSGSLTVKLPTRLALYLDTVNGSITCVKMDGDIHFDTTNGAIQADGTNGDANLDTTNGSITLGKVGGRVHADTTNGAITLLDVGGAIDASTTNGGIKAVLAGTLAGDVSLDTTNGAITLEVGPNSNFEVRADTSNGRVHDSLPAGRFSGDYNKRRTYMKGTVGSGGYKVTLDTTNGSIYIKER